MMLSDVCLCVYLSGVCLSDPDVCLSGISGLSREQRPRKTKIGIEVAHVTRVTRTPLSRSKVTQRSRSPGRFTHHGLNAWGRCSGDRENVLDVENYCYVRCVCSAAGEALGRPRGRRGAGHIVSSRAQLVSTVKHRNFNRLSRTRWMLLYVNFYNFKRDAWLCTQAYVWRKIWWF